MNCDFECRAHLSSCLFVSEEVDIEAVYIYHAMLDVVFGDGAQLSHVPLSASRGSG